MDAPADSLEVYVRAASHLYQAALNTYSSLPGAVEIQEPPMPVLVDKPLTSLPADISQKVEEYQGIVIQGMSRNTAEAKRYLDAALYVLYDVYFLKMNVQGAADSEVERHANSADQVWDSFRVVDDKVFLDSIDELMGWFEERIDPSS